MEPDISQSHVQEKAKQAASMWTPASALDKFNMRKKNAALFNKSSIDFMYTQFLSTT
jgi:hypothetical protein